MAPVKHPVFQAEKIAEEPGEATHLALGLTGPRKESYDSGEARGKPSNELAGIVTTTLTRAPRSSGSF